MEIQEIKRILKERHITYPELSKMTGLSVSCITKVFGGFAQNPRVETIRTIERALGLENKQISETSSAAELPEDETRLLNAYRTLSSEMKEHSIEIIETLAKTSGTGK